MDRGVLEDEARDLEAVRQERPQLEADAEAPDLDHRWRLAAGRVGEGGLLDHGFDAGEDRKVDVAADGEGAPGRLFDRLGNLGLVDGRRDQHRHQEHPRHGEGENTEETESEDAAHEKAPGARQGKSGAAKKWPYTMAPS